MDFKQWIQQTCIPIVLTSPTHQVERLVQKNGGLTLTDLLNAFTILENVDTPIRTVTHHINLKEFRFQFQSITQFRPVPLEIANEVLNHSIQSIPPVGFCNDTLKVQEVSILQSHQDVKRIVSSLEYDPLPWFTNFRKELFNTLQHQENQFLSYPIALVYFVSSSEPNPIEAFQALEQSKHPNSFLPESFQRGIYQMKSILKYYVLVHDLQESINVNVDGIYSQMVSTLSSSCSKVLYLNSLPISSPNTQQYDLWTGHPHMKPYFFPESIPRFPFIHPCLGCCLSKEDLDNLRSFVWNFGVKHIIPALETRMFSLNENVTAVKKGMKNVIKSWWRKPKETIKTIHGNAGYQADSIESQSRLLADTAFLVHDYELALSTYRLVREDYKADRSNLLLASTFEMISLCLLFINGTINQISNSIEQAIHIYQTESEVSIYARRMSIRSCVLASEIYRSCNQMDKASSCLTIGSMIEKGISVPVLLEGAALCDLLNPIPKFRKYGFRMAMAGHMYYQVHQQPHAVRCYAHAKAVYENTKWHHVEDHINFTLARHVYQLGDTQLSIDFFLKLIGNGRQSKTQQETFLREFAVVVKEHQHIKTIPKHIPFLMNDFCLPLIKDETIRIYAQKNALNNNKLLNLVDKQHEDDNNNNNNFIDSSLENLTNWNKMKQILKEERNLEEMIEKNECTWTNVPSSPRFRARMKTLNCSSLLKSYVVDEKIYVEFQMDNLLSCDVSLYQLHVYGKFYYSTEDEEKDENKENNMILIPQDCCEKNCIVVVEKKDIVLNPLSYQMIQLYVIPKQVGKFDIIGVRWFLFHEQMVCGQHEFHVRGPLLQDTRIHRALSMRASNHLLNTQIIPAMPWLGIEIISSSTFQFLLGEIKCFTLHLKNYGQASIHRLFLISNHSNLCIGQQEEKKKEDYKNDDMFKTLSCRKIGRNGCIHEIISSTMPLHSNESLNLPLWIQGEGEGTKKIQFLFQYENHSSSSFSSMDDSIHNNIQKNRIRSRTLEYTFSIQVQPSFSISHLVRPSYDRCGEYVLGLTLTNHRNDNNNNNNSSNNNSNDRTIEIDQITSISQYWKLEPFSSSSSSSFSIKWREATTFYFRICPVVLSSSQTINELYLTNLPLAIPTAYHLYNNSLLPVFSLMGCHAARIRSYDQKKQKTWKKKQPQKLRTIQSVRREKQKTNEEQKNQNNSSIQYENITPTSLQALANHSDLSLLILWSTKEQDQKIIGQEHLLNIVVRPPLNPRHCPLTISVNYQPTITLQQGSKNKEWFGALPVEFEIRNGTMDSASSVDFTIEMLGPLDTPLGTTDKEKKNQPSPYIFWMGCTKKRVEGFRPNAIFQHKLEACFTSPGVYDLNRFLLIIDSSSNPSPPTVYVFPTQYLVNVLPPTPSL